METARKALAAMANGHITQMWGVIAYRLNKEYWYIGETINPRKDQALHLEDAATTLCKIIRDRP